MRNCGEYELLISAFLDGELSGEERAETAEHLAACPRCRQYFDDLAAMHDTFDWEQVPVPEGFAESVMARVRETPQEGKVIRFPRWRRWTAVAACCAVAALGLWSAKMWTPASGVASQTAMADSAMVMPRSAEASGGAEEADDGGIMLLMDSDSAEPEASAEFAEQKNAAADLTNDGAVIAGDAPKRETDTCDEAADSLEMVPAAAPVKENASSGTITAGGPAARAWVEETLGLEWEPGRIYPLTEEEFTGLLDALTVAGEDFWREAGGSCQLLAAEPDA